MAKVTEMKRSRSHQRVKNMLTVGAGQLGNADRAANVSVPYYSSNPETFTNPLERWRQFYLMYQTSWECRKIVCIPVEDALRKPPLLKGIDPEIALGIKKEEDRLQFWSTTKRSLKLERLFGGCLEFMGIEDEEDDPSRVYKAKEGKRLAFVNSIPISRISRMTWDTNPLSANYMRPHEFYVNNQSVSVSRCLLWDGQPLIDPNDFALTNYRANLAGFGQSVLGAIYDDIIQACGTRQAAYQLIQTNNAIIAAVQQLQDLAGTDPGVKNLQQIQQVAQQLSAFRVAMIDGEKVELKNMSASFGSVPELLMMFLQVLSAASDIPATRFLGQAPGGLNATGESDLENYYNGIDCYQHERITPQYLRFLDVVGYNKFPDRWAAEREKLEVEWPPLWNETAKEMAERASLTIDNVLKLVDAALMGDEQALEEINARGILSVKLEKDDLQLLGEARDLINEKLGGGEPEDKTDQDAGNGLQRLRNVAALGSPTPSTRSGLEQAFLAACQRLSLDPNAFDREQALAGAAHEMEHQDVLSWDSIDDRVQAAGIALDHLREDPEYYKKLGRIENYITESGGKYTVHAESGKKMGTYGSKAEAEKRLREIEYFKHQNSPTPAQAAAGNYKKEHIRVHGLDIAIENPKGSVRAGRDPETLETWAVTMPCGYGYIKHVPGADGDALDVFVGPDPTSEKVFIIDQRNCSTFDYDETKCILGCGTKDEARDLYASAFSDGKGLGRIMALSEVGVDAFKQWVKEGDTTKPYHMSIGADR